MKSKEVKAISFVLALILAFAGSAVGAATANPLTPPMIDIHSPHNNQVYPTSTVELSFTPLSTFNFTSYSYSLDGQQPQSTNGYTFLSGLAAGSHRVEVYGNSTSYGGGTYRQLLDIVYFSVSYSTSWLAFTFLILTTTLLLSLGLFVNRRQVAMHLKAKKTASFWVGLVCLLFFGLVVFAPLAWRMTSNYLFPHYSHGALVDIYALPLFVLMFFAVGFMVVGFVLMAHGSRNDRQNESLMNKSNF